MTRPGLGCNHCCPPRQGYLMGTLAQNAQPLCSSLLIPQPWPAHQEARNSLQAMALGPCEVHVAVQGPGEVLQGFFCHGNLPLGHEDVLAREVAQSARAAQDTDDRLAEAARRAPPCLTCIRPGLP